MKPAERLLHAVLDPLRLHPLISPFLECYKEPPLQHFLHQYELLAMLVPRLPVRAFIGDEIGLGKTISAIAIAKCLWKQWRVKRVLITVPRVLLYQWRKELERMGIPATKIRGLEREDIPLLKARGFPEGFYIASMDLIKREPHVERIEDVPWDMVIVDEAHKFGYKTKRFKNVGRKLLEADPERNVLLLSATPHRGHSLDYIKRLGLVDPYLLVGRELDNPTFYALTHGSIMFRRTKEDVNSIYEGRQVFLPATFYACLVKASSEEADLVNRTVSFLQSKLVEFAFERGSLEAKVLPLLKTLVFKRASSSPYALMTTVNRMLAKRAVSNPRAAERLVSTVRSFLGVDFGDYALDVEPDELVNEFLEHASFMLSEDDAEELSSLLELARRIVEGGGDSKLKALLSLLESVVADGLKSVVFTEYKDTLDYAYYYLAKTKPEWRLLRLSSEETRNPDAFNKIRETFERDPEAKILLATDVVAEGVNMQVANILINYEVPWSIIKLEQRIGRVWRLGQKRSVEAYTFFMDNRADKAALNRMYEKLMNLSAARLKPRAITGEELLLYADAGNVSGFPPRIPPEAARHRKGVRISEHKLIKTFIEDGETSLEAIVAVLMEARRRLMRELESKGVLHAPRSRGDVERVTSDVGFRDQNELFSSLECLLKVVAPYIGVELEERNGELLASIGDGMPFPVRTLDDFFSLLLPQSTCEQSRCVMIALGDSDDSLMLVEAKARIRGVLIYSEPLMVSLKDGTVYRGASLLRKVSEIVPSLLGLAEEAVPELPLYIHAKVASQLKSALSEAYSPLEAYRNRLEELRSGDRWARLSEVEVDVEPQLFIKIIPKASASEPSEEVKREAENKAIEYAIDFERKQGRIPINVSATEHYDIKSISKSSDEVLYIEVKGHMGPVASAELTGPEAKFAKEMGKAYWLYIVYDLSSAPKMLRFRDPMNSLAWRVIEKVERRYVWP
jgi:hypothetical protein